MILKYAERESGFRLARTPEPGGSSPSSNSSNLSSPPVLATVNLNEIGEPSAGTIFVVSIHWPPWSCLANVLAFGAGPSGPSNVDFATLSFQVPRNGSAARSEPVNKSMVHG